MKLQAAPDRYKNSYEQEENNHCAAWPISNLPLAALISDLKEEKESNYNSHTWIEGLEKSIIYLTAIADLDQHTVKIKQCFFLLGTWKSRIR